MKKILKTKIFFFFLGAIIFGSIGAVSAYTLLASDVVYKNTTVENALNDLYEKENKSISGIGDSYTKSLYSANRENKKIELELEKGKYICSVVYSNATDLNKLNTNGKSSQTLNITGCDDYKTLYEYQNYQSAKEAISASLILNNVLIGKNFYCATNEKKNINIQIDVANVPSNNVPMRSEVFCNKLNME